jgi:hypothetical protein
MAIQLYEIEPRYRAWAERAAAADWELDDALVAELDAIEAGLHDRAAAGRALIAELEAEERAYRDHARRLAAEGLRRGLAAERLRARLAAAMRAVGVDVVHLDGGGRVSRVKNPVPAIRWPFSSDPPARFRRVEVSLDGRAAQAAYQEGTLPVEFEVIHGEHLRFR